MESFKVSQDAQLYPWACALIMDCNSLFALPDISLYRLPNQWLNTLISRHEFVELEALVWLIARSLLFDIPSRNFSKKSLAESRIKLKIASFALKVSEDWGTRLRRCRVSSLTLRLHSQFEKSLHDLLKQLKGFVSQLDLLESSISVVFALHTVREEQNRAEMELPIVRPPQVGGDLRAKPSPTAASSPGLGQSSAGSSPGTGQASRAQRRKFKQPICWKYTEKGQCYYSCKKRHISKEALAVINCPHFEKKGSCRFHETSGTWCVCGSLSAG